jgi:hypothetical protein
MSSKQGPRALTPNPSPAAAGEGSVACACGAETGTGMRTPANAPGRRRRGNKIRIGRSEAA